MGADSLSEILERDLVRPVYQPIVDLYGGTTVAYEALARGPEGPLERPDRLFGAARAQGRLSQLDDACRSAAVRGALGGGLRAPSTLFVNVEPQALGSWMERDLRRLSEVSPDLPIVFEVTERALTSRPADLIPTARAARDLGFGIALDDVGADRRSLALMPFLRPDVIKLDLRLTQDRPSGEIAEVHNAVSAQAERTGALIVAEGIETPAHAERARAMGAALGQGWLLGRPGPLPAEVPFPGRGVPLSGSAAPDSVTPFEAARGRRPLRRAKKRLLLEISRELERQAFTLGSSAVIISTFQEARHFTEPTRGIYEDLADRTAFVGALGRGMGVEPAHGVRGSQLAASDPLAMEWDIAVVGPHFAASFAARDLGDSGTDMDRRFDFTLTHDRDLAITAARSLMARIAPVADHAPLLPAGQAA